jgi:SARP family transcriptional regulator, regulator of embCAB operon
LVELRLLGPVEVWDGDHLLQAGAPRQRAVLAGLLIDAGQVVSTATLIDRVWGDHPPAQVTKTLSAHISRLRRVLEQASRDAAAVEVVKQPGGYRLTASPDQVDLLCFRDLVAQAQHPACAAEQRVALLCRALALWRGDPLAGVDGEWASRRREHLIGERLAATVAWADAELALGNATAILAPLVTLADTYPLMEPLTVAMVRALVAAGRPTEALERCRSHWQRLVDEYGTDQGPQLRALYTAVLRGDGHPPGAPAAPPSPAPSVAPVSPQPTVVAPQAAPPPIGTVIDTTTRGEREHQGAPAAPPLPAVSPLRHGPWRHTALVVAGACATLAVLLGVVVVPWPDRRPTAGSRLTVREDFTGTTLDVTQWAVYDMKRENGSSWSPSMVRVAGGELQISGSGRNPTGAGNVAGGVCWCKERGPVRRYGVWSVRAKFDVGTGYGPIIGLWPDRKETADDWSWLTLARLDEPTRTRMYPAMGDRDGIVPGSPTAGDLTAWNTYSVEWRPKFVTISLNDMVVFDTRKIGARMRIPSVPMYLYIQVVPGPDGPVPAPDQSTPSQVVTHIGWATYAS